MSDEQAPAAPEAPQEEAPGEGVPPEEGLPEQDPSSGEVTVPLNEKASRKEEAIAKLRAALKEEEGVEEPEAPADPLAGMVERAMDKPFSVSKEEFDALPEKARELIANLRAMTTRKTQDLAQERKALRAQQEALTNGKFLDELKARAEADVGFDPFSPESVQAHIDKQVAAALRQALEPVRQEVELSNRRAQLERFKAENPDINQPEVKKAVVGLLKQDESLTLERAYAIVRGERALSEKQALAEELARIRGEAKKAGLKIGGASRATASSRVPAAVRAQGGWAVAQWLQANRK